MVKYEPLPSQAVLSELFSYCEKDGILRRKSVVGRLSVGSRVGFVNTDGYRLVTIKGRRFSETRIIWKIVHGCDPKSQIDHINRNKQDNRLENLREATGSENCMNRNVGPNNTSGYKGVVWHIRSKKWIARIKIAGRVVHLGMFSSLENAVMARQTAAGTFHRCFSCENSSNRMAKP